MTLKVIPLLQAFSSAILRTFVPDFLPDFNWQHACAVPQRQLGFLSSSVKLHGRRTISGKLLAFGFVATMRLLSNYFDLLYFTPVLHCCLLFSFIAHCITKHFTKSQSATLYIAHLQWFCRSLVRDIFLSTVCSKFILVLLDVYRSIKSAEDIRSTYRGLFLKIIWPFFFDVLTACCVQCFCLCIYW